MVRWAGLPSSAQYALLCLLFAIVGACGRVGIRQLPLAAGHAASGGAGSEADSGAAGDASCPTLCENAHGSADCSSGTCLASCANGYQDCDGDETNGCEVSIQDATAQCGSCMVACVNDHGMTGCEEGLCMPGCAAGYADCDELPNNGCETALNTASDCGACGRTCENAHGSASCTSGTCAIACAAGYADCDGNAANGCETITSTDPMHCGSCSGVCQAGSQICSGGSCLASTCPAGKAECDGDTSVGCETDLTSSLSNCSFCGNVCMAANGTPQCVNSACGVAGCNGGYADCDALPSNGCEVTLANNVAHCGDCTVACSNAHGSTSCAAGACAPVCSTNYGNCDGDTTNGCEASLNSVSNCGMCGKTCPANGGTAGCAAGVCTTTCDLTGRYALKLSVPANWPSTTYLSSGNGTFTFWGELQLTQTGSALSGALWMCGETVPDFQSTPLIQEKYGVTFPNALFDGTALPSTPSSGTLGSSSPGASFVLARSAILAGATLSDPVNDAWPSAAAIVSADSDADGKPGLTVLYKSGGSYDSPPTNDLGTTRAIRGYLTTRIVFSLSGTLTSCTQASGSVAPVDIDVHTLGCRISGDSRDCNSGDTNHLDDDAPNYTPSSGSYSLVKVSNTATCSTIRSALP
jgi:hypothetical protein